MKGRKQMEANQKEKERQIDRVFNQFYK